MHPYRSLLFVPGHKPDWADKAVKAGADAVVLDLEDSVPDAGKAAARRQVRDSIERLRAGGARAGLLVRVNGLATRLTGADLEEVVVPGLDGIFAPKIEQAILAHPAVEECAVIGVAADVEAGEDEVMAVLTTAKSVPPAEIWDWCQGRMPAFAIPRFLRFVDALPKTPSEKIRKAELRRVGITADTFDRTALAEKP